MTFIIMAGGQGAKPRSVFNKDSVVRGHHIYKTYWTPVVGEELTLEMEDDNEHGEHAVAVMKDGYLGWHMPLILWPELIFETWR